MSGLSIAILIFLLLTVLLLAVLIAWPAIIAVLGTAHAVAARYAPASTINVEENVVCCQWSSIHVVFGFVYVCSMFAERFRLVVRALPFSHPLSCPIAPAS